MEQPAALKERVEELRREAVGAGRNFSIVRKDAHSVIYKTRSPGGPWRWVEVRVWAASGWATAGGISGARFCQAQSPSGRSWMVVECPGWGRLRVRLRLRR